MNTDNARTVTRKCPCFRIGRVWLDRQLAPGTKVQCKVHGTEQHEHDGDGFDRGTLVLRETGIVDRESTRGNSREAVRDGIEGRHTGKPVAQCAGDREKQVQAPQCLCRMLDSWTQFVTFSRSGRLGFHELHAADAEHRHQGNRCDDDADAAQPLDLLPVKQKRLWKIVKADDRRGACRRKSGSGFEYGGCQCPVCRSAQKARRRAG